MRKSSDIKINLKLKNEKHKGIEFFGQDGEPVEDYKLPGSEIRYSNNLSQVSVMRKGDLDS